MRKWPTVLCTNWNKFFYPPLERFLRTLSEGSHWFECSLLACVIFCFFGFPLGTSLTYCVMGGGWWGVFPQVVEVVGGGWDVFSQVEEVVGGGWGVFSQAEEVVGGG